MNRLYVSGIFKIYQVALPVRNQLLLSHIQIQKVRDLNQTRRKSTYSRVLFDKLH